MKRKALKAAFPHTLPICIGFLFLGISYGFLMRSKGFSFIYPMFMSMFIFAGSMEFVTINLLFLNFDPMTTFLLTLMVNARHIFYGISMLGVYQNCGLKKLYLIFGMCDESFSINSSVKLPSDVDAGWFMFWVTLLNHIYWVTGATLGGLLGYVIQLNTKGIEFVMTALFVVMFINQWEETKNHLPAIIGVTSSMICLILFGNQNFMIPAMLMIVFAFALKRNSLEKKDEVYK